MCDYRQHRPHHVVGFSLFLLLSLAAPRSTSAQFQVDVAFPNLLFELPTDFASDGAGHLYVTEQRGVIHAFQNDSTVAETKIFLDIESKVRLGGESGLLGLAFHPEYESNGYFFIFYTGDNPLRSILSRFHRSDTDSLVADPTSELILLELPKQSARHNGGDMAFDSEGYLLVSLGDASSGGDQFQNGQNLKTLFGSIIRIDVDQAATGLNYGIPADNPLVGNIQGNREEIFAYGFRNPWRFSIDPISGDIWVGDVGESTWEEVDYVVKGGNYGWPIVEGDACYQPPQNCVLDGLVPPVHSYHHDEGISVIGGVVYRGQRVPKLVGKYLFADWYNRTIYAISYEGDPTAAGSQVSVEPLVNTTEYISAFGVDENNEPHMVLTFTGKVLRFVATTDLDAENPEPVQPRFTFDVIGPNPFSGRVNLRLNATDASHVRVTAFDVLGRQIEVLFEGYTSSAREIEFSGDAMPSGAYFVVAEFGSEVITRKVLLIR